MPSRPGFLDFPASLPGGAQPRISVADSPGNRKLIKEKTRSILAAGAVPLMIGGDDSVPIPFLAGLADHGPIWILQIGRLESSDVG